MKALYKKNRRKGLVLEGLPYDDKAGCLPLLTRSIEEFNKAKLMYV